MSKLFVGGLSWHTDDATLRSRFEEFGPVSEAVVVNDKETGRSRGFGFVRYANEQDAQCAIAAMHNTEFDGRTIRVDPASDGRGAGRGCSSGFGNRGNYSGGGGGYNNYQPPGYPPGGQGYNDGYGRGYAPQHPGFSGPPQGYAPPAYGYQSGSQQQQSPGYPQQQPPPPHQGGRGF